MPNACISTIRCWFFGWCYLLLLQAHQLLRCCKNHMVYISRLTLWKGATIIVTHYRATSRPANLSSSWCLRVRKDMSIVTVKIGSDAVFKQSVLKGLGKCTWDDYRPYQGCTSREVDAIVTVQSQVVLGLRLHVYVLDKSGMPHILTSYDDYSRPTETARSSLRRIPIVSA